MPLQSYFIAPGQAFQTLFPEVLVEHGGVALVWVGAEHYALFSRPSGQIGDEYRDGIEQVDTLFNIRIVACWP